MEMIMNDESKELEPTETDEATVDEVESEDTDEEVDTDDDDDVMESAMNDMTDYINEKGRGFIE